jgi:pimeloyl-ACP methyl ester carboxylesterase
MTARNTVSASVVPLALAVPLVLLTGHAAHASAGGAAACEALASPGSFAQTAVTSARHIAANADKKLPAFCEVTATVKPAEASNIVVVYRLPENWNGKLLGLGGGGWAGNIAMATAEPGLTKGFATAQTDGGHFTGVVNGAPDVWNTSWSSNPEAVTDFQYRAIHLMTEVGKQVVAKYYGEPQKRAYFQGCSTGGRQGLMMAQRYPEDYNGILAGAPAINWDRFQAAQLWPQVAMRIENGGAVDAKKITLATNAAIEACDGLDGVKDGVLEEPRACKFDARTLVCTGGAAGDSCLTTGEAAAINKIWEGPKGHWYGLTRSTPVQQMLAGAQPFMISINQPRYWVYLDPTWDWKTLTYDNYGKFFEDTMRAVGPVMASNNPDLEPFRKHGGKLILWHGWSDPGIMPEGTIDYYEKVAERYGRDYKKTREFARLYMAPGVGHCAGGVGPQPQGMFDALVSWVEKGEEPQKILATKTLPDGKVRTRPLCAYPAVTNYRGIGSTDEAASFQCVTTKIVR